MPEPHRLLGTYLHLARASQVRMQPMVRDKLLVLAGVQAEAMGLAPIAALCRHKVLSHNAQHMIRDWPTLEGALADERFRTYFKQLERRYSKEKSEHMLASLGIEMGRERELYASDLEYAAALLDTDLSALDDVLRVASPRSTAAVSGNPNGHAPNGQAHRAATARRLPWRNLLVVWGPFVLGVAALLATALVARTSSP
ncbi:MAG: hypothetical protein AB7O59_05815 [Pirellulales bacterium]